MLLISSLIIDWLPTVLLCVACGVDVAAVGFGGLTDGNAYSASDGAFITTGCIWLPATSEVAQLSATLEARLRNAFASEY